MCTLPSEIITLLETIDLIQLHCPPTQVYYRPEIFELFNDLKKEVNMGKLFNMHGHEAHCHLTRVSEEDIDIDGKTTKHTKKHQVKLMTQAEFCRYPIYDVSRLPFISSIRSKVSQGKNKVIYYKIY